MAAEHLQELRERPMVFVDDLERPMLEADDLHHLERALRVKAGAPVTVCDGNGRWRSARFGSEPQVDGPVVTEHRQQPSLTVAFAPVKGDRSDLVVQKLTELGIDTIVPLLTERSVVRWDQARTAKNLTRHLRIAREAAMQSRNPWLPTIEPLTGISTVKANHPGLLFADPVGQPLVGRSVSQDPISVAVGPEGGFSPGELAQQPTVALPGRILRTETAAITAAVLLVGARSFIPVQ